MATTTVTVDQGGAGFAANEDLSVKKVDPEGRCDEAGVTVGMYVVEFQGSALAPGTTWATLRQMVKGAERPWSFVFSACPPGSVNVEVGGDGGAGFAANEDLTLRKVDPGKACDDAGVKVGMRVYSFQGEVLAADETWSILKAKVKDTPKPWQFTFVSAAEGAGGGAGPVIAEPTGWLSKWMHAPAAIPVPATPAVPAGPSASDEAWRLEKEWVEKAVAAALEKGQQAMAEGDFNGAIQAYVDGQKEDKRNESLAYNLKNAKKLQGDAVVASQEEGKAAIAAADYEKAIVAYKRALEVDLADPRKVGASLKRAETDLATITDSVKVGTAAMESESFVEAINAFKKGAAINNAHEELKKLVKTAVRQGELALVKSAADGDAGRLDVLVKSGHVNVNSTAEASPKCSPIMEAAKNGHLMCVKQLVENGAEVGAADEDGMTAFHYSCASGHDDCVDALLGYDCNVTAKTSSEETGFDLATKAGHTSVLSVMQTAMIAEAKAGALDKMRKYLDTGVDVDTRASENGSTAVMQAAEAGKVACVQDLLAREANIGITDSEGMSALLYSAKGGSAGAVKLLVDAGADVLGADSNGMTAFLTSCAGGQLECAKMLFDAGSDAGAQNNDGETAFSLASSGGHHQVTTKLELELIEATKSGNVSQVTALLNGGADANAVSVVDKGRSVLVLAGAAGSVACVEVFLQNGGLKEKADQEGATAFHVSCAGGHCDCVKALVAAGTDVTASDNGSKTGWALASANGHTEVTRFLELQFLSAGEDNQEALLRSYILGEVDINAKDEGDGGASSAFHICCAKGFAGCVEALVEAGCIVTDKDAEGKTGLDLALSGEHEAVKQVLDHAMVAAAKTGSTERMSNFLDIGVSVDVCHAQSGKTALMESSAGGHDAAVTCLLDRNATHSIADTTGTTALMLAAGAGAANCVTQLVTAGSGLDPSENSGMTAFMFACLSGHTEAVTILTSAGCKIDVKNQKGDTGWTLATKGHWEPVKKVLEGLLLVAAKSLDAPKLEAALAAGVNVDAVSGSGRTALIEVATSGHVELLMGLLGSGAGMEFRDADGTSAFHAACAGGHAGCAETLVKRGCKTSQRDGGSRMPMQHAKENGHNDVVAVLQRMKLVVRVTEDLKFNGDHTRYIVETSIDGDLISTQTHRYSEFDNLRNAMLELQKWKTEVGMFVFPKKASVGALMQRKSAKVVERRVKELSEFMNSTIAIGELRDNDTVRAFIGAPFTKAPVMPPKPPPAKVKAPTAAPAKSAAAGAGGAEPIASGGDAVVRIKIEDGGAGFAANEVLAVKKVNPGEASEQAGVKVGMRVHSFQGEILAHGTTWDDLKGKVKAAPKPWTFVFAGTVRVEVAEGGAGFAANEDLTVKKIDEGKACEQAGVVMGMHVVSPRP